MAELVSRLGLTAFLSKALSARMVLSAPVTADLQVPGRRHRDERIKNWILMSSAVTLGSLLSPPIKSQVSHD